MFDAHAVARQVQRNCDISDARHAGLYSICGLALRLRDLYKWETGTPPWEEKASGEVLEWIGHREEHWDALAQEDFGPVTVDGHPYAAFSTRKINAALAPHGFFYGAGYAYSLKPTFFMAAVTGRRHLGGTPVYILGRELARDLMTLPALAQDASVVLRTEAAGLYLWDKILYIRKSGRRALEAALNACGVTDHRPEGIRQHLGDILAACRDNFIYHEIGEISDPVFRRGHWQEIVAAFPHSAVELLARHVRDLLADTAERGPLMRIVTAQDKAALGFYTAFLEGMALELFPELRPAFEAFSAGGRWDEIAEAVGKGRGRAQRYASQLVALYQAGRQRDDLKWAAAAIEKELLQPLIGSRTAA